jgi:hypothetical protein
MARLADDTKKGRDGARDWSNKSAVQPVGDRFTLSARGITGAEFGT